MWVKIDFVAFTVSDFQDLLDILQSNRAWREDMRRVLLDEEIARVWKGIDELRQSIRELSDQQDSRFSSVDSNIEGVKINVGAVEIHLAKLKGEHLESAFRERPFVYLSRFARRLRKVEDAEFGNLIEDAIDTSRITEAEAEELKRLDAIAKGKSKGDGTNLYLAVEVSYVVDMHDLERAERRAALLAKATGESAQAVVAGNTILSEVRQVAEQRGIYCVIKE